MKSGSTTGEILYNREGSSASGSTNSRTTTIPSSQQTGQSSGQLTMSQLLDNANSSQSANASSCLNHQLGPSGQRSGNPTHLLSTIPPSQVPSNSSKTNIENNMQHSNTGDNSTTSLHKQSTATNPQLLSMPSQTTTTHASSQPSNLSQAEMAKELEDVKDRLKIMTQKFASTRKERDQLKTDNKELQDEVIQLQSSMRQMVPCMSNTSQSFPMFNELSNQCSEMYKCDCQDVFFDLLCPELNLEGVVFFYQNIFPPLMVAIQKHFAPAEQVLHQVSCLPQLDGPVESVLRKTYQSNWRQIMKASLTDQFFQSLALQIQDTLSINDGDEIATTQIKQFAVKISELCFKMVISDPPMCLDLASIGQKVRYNQYKYDSMDGFVRADDECFIVLPSVHKQVMNTSSSGTQQTSAQGGSSFTQGGHSGSLGEVLIKANVLPLNYEFP